MRVNDMRVMRATRDPREIIAISPRFDLDQLRGDPARLNGLDKHPGTLLEVSRDSSNLH
jgi:hypothetical protein